jgi:hypothetical protein
VSYGAKKHENMQSFGASIGICCFGGQQGHAGPGSPNVPYPPFAGVDAELLTAEPAGPWLSPPQALNVVATNRASAVICNAFLINGTRFFMATSDEPKRVSWEAGTVWTVLEEAPDNGGQRDAGMQWRNKLDAEIAKLLLGRV